jgi:hypothetical protein
VRRCRAFEELPDGQPHASDRRVRTFRHL